MKHICVACKSNPMRIDAYKIHLARDKHIINQSIYDGEQLAMFEKEREEWDKERAKLLKINKGDIENSISLRDINDELRRRIEMYQENERKREREENNQEKMAETQQHHINLLIIEREKWAIKEKAFQKEIRIMKQQFELALATMKQANDDLLEQLNPTISIEQPSINDRLEALENIIVEC